MAAAHGAGALIGFDGRGDAAEDAEKERAGPDRRVGHGHVG